jgi:hypothetical protein
MRRLKLKVSCFGIEHLNRYEIPNVDVYLATISTAGAYTRPFLSST